MVKENRGIFFKVFLVVMVILIFNIGLFVYNSGAFKINKGLTGFVAQDVTDYYTLMSLNTKIFLIGIWAILILVLISVYIKDIRTLQEENIKTIVFKKLTGQSKTDLDSLYETLQEKKSFKVSTIAKSFKVSKDVAMEWCKILETADLATVDYPNIGGPILSINKPKEELETNKKIN